jgi:2-dehydropantoate 2-reductase
MSLQNGLDNIEKIEKYVSRDRIAVCITTHGAIFSKPGAIIHTGFGKTIIGNPNCEDTNKLFDIVKDFNQSGIETTVSDDIICDIWIKGIINSSINPLTTIFHCKNGYLLENPILEKLVEKICKESTDIAYSNGLDLDYNEMIMKTKKVIYDTNENFSSMLQSYKKGKKTEIDSINGVILKIGKKNDLNVFLNDFLVHLITSI